MPELPDLTVYLEHLDRLLDGARLERITVLNPFVLRTVEPKPAAFEGKRCVGTARIGKRLVLSFEEDLHAVIHLMVAGRLRWLLPGRKAPARITLATFAFAPGTLAFTEAGSKRRASLHLAQGAAALAAFDPGGSEPLALSADEFRARLMQSNHTLKRALTDPYLFSGIGNAYSDNETNYCARCQTGGRILADRALSRLLKASWPKSIDESG